MASSGRTTWRRRPAILAVLALAVPFEALGHLFARGLYATHNTVLPVLASLAGFGVTIATTLLLVPTLDVLAIPVGFAAGAPSVRRWTRTAHPAGDGACGDVAWSARDRVAAAAYRLSVSSGTTVMYRPSRSG